MKRAFSLLLAGAVAIGGAATGFAAPMAPSVFPAVVNGNGEAKIQEVQNRWDSTSAVRDAVRANRGSRHCRRGNCWDNDWRRHRDWDDDWDDDDFGDAAAAGIFGLAAGALVGSALSQGGSYGGDYHAACSRKYRSYDPATGTYMGYDGYRHPCVLP
jgi:hypothetical protein